MNIYDIADKAGVSIATVSRVLNGSPNVSAKTLERVMHVMEEEGYVPNAFARGLGLDTMKMIGVLCTDVSDLYYAQAVSVVEHALREYGFNSLLCCTGEALDQKREALELLVQKRVDAILLIGSAFHERADNTHIEEAARHVPIVIINGLVEVPNSYCVLCDEENAMRDCVTALARGGSRGILYLYNVDTYSGIQKLAGYRRGLEEAGLPADPALIIKTERDLSCIDRDISALVEGGTVVDAVLASEDYLAVGALKAFARRGVTLPVIGCNNSILAECSSPSLTSIDNRLDALCTSAVRCINDILSGREVAERSVFPAELVERDTFHIPR